MHITCTYVQKKATSCHVNSCFALVEHVTPFALTLGNAHCTHCAS